MGASVAVAPAASAKTGSLFDFTHAHGFERVTFTGDAAASCERYGVCGYSGTVTYAIGGKPRGSLILVRGRGGRLDGGASYRTRGVTTATVTPPGSGPTCTDSVARRTDVFSAKTLPSSTRMLLVSYHAGGGDFLDTRCVGPTERTLAAAGALPEGPFPASGFRGSRLRFGFSGGMPFTRGGFSARSEWRLSFKAAGRSCNPRCRVPAHHPR
jgi:hypothetical protein